MALAPATAIGRILDQDEAAKLIRSLRNGRGIGAADDETKDGKIMIHRLVKAARNNYIFVS